MRKLGWTLLALLVAAPLHAQERWDLTGGRVSVRFNAGLMRDLGIRVGPAVRIDKDGYAYFRKRLTEARRDVEHGLAITLDWYKTREQQARMIKILQFKLDVLWTMADAMYMAYINGMPPYFNVG